MSRALLLLLCCSPACVLAPSPGDPVAYHQAFEDPAALADFVFSDPGAWRLGEVGGRRCLEQFRASEYEPRVRSPHNLALLRTPALASFTLDAQVQQTGPEYPHRDLLLVFAFQDPEHFLYAHLASSADENAHQVMLVDGAPRRPVTTARTQGVDWGSGEWLPLRVERDAASASIRVWLGAAREPVLVAEGTAPGEGWIGFGSFDDTAAFDDVTVRCSGAASPARAAALRLPGDWPGRP